MVRRLAGYERLSGIKAAAGLARLYDSARLYVNFFQPSFKLAGKQRDGALIRKHYHSPRTPCQRLLASDWMGEPAKQRLRQQFAALDPVALLKAIRDTQRELAAIGEGNASPEPPTDIAVFLENLASAWRNEHPPRRQRRRNAANRHWWRTRIDPFADSWPLVENWLAAEPNLAAAELLVRLRAQLSDLYPTGAQLRTLQQRVKSWRAEWARRLVFATTASTDTPAVVDPGGPD